MGAIQNQPLWFAVCILMFRALLFLAVAISSGTVGAAGQTQATGNQPSRALDDRIAAEKRAVKGIDDFGQVTPMLFRGAQPSAEGFEALARMGANIVVDLRGDRASEREQVQKLGMQYIAIPWHCWFPRDELFVQFLKLLRDHPKQKVFVHCRVGDDRTGMMIASYRMAAEGWSADDAMREMQSFGYNRTHHLICPPLERYEQNFPTRLKTNPAFEGLRSSPPNPSPDTPK